MTMKTSLVRVHPKTRETRMPGDQDRTVLTVLRHLVGHGPLGRTEVAEEVGLARATTSSIVNDLMRRNLIAEIAMPSEGRRGRPVGLLDLDDERYAATTRV
jgi:predicted transcriptional regulator